jgi:DNA modification methylase
MMSIETYLENFRLHQENDLFSSSAPKTIVDEVCPEGYKIPRFINEFWTSSQRQGHSLHEISYRACFKAELPRFFIELFTKQNDLVYDPFMGRGTTLLEASLLGRHVAGNDVNPLSRILIEPRLNPPELAKIHERLHSISWDGREKADIDLSMFYSPSTEKNIVILKKYLIKRKASGSEDMVDKWLRMAATNRLTGHSSGFFSVYSLPPNQTVSPVAQKKINEKRRQTPPDRDVISIIEKKSRDLQKDLTNQRRSNLQQTAVSAKYFCQDAQDKIGLHNETVDLIVTSPPFLDTVQYADDNWLRCWFNNIDAREVGKKITMSRSVEDWASVMKNVFREFIRILKPNGWIAFEVGEVRGGKVFLDEIIAPVGIKTGFICHGIVVNVQHFTKTSQCWGIKNNLKGTNTNRIVIFQKE